MIILAVESSSRAAGAAVTNDGRLVCEVYSESGVTHSKALLPMVDFVLSHSDTPVDRVDVFAVTTGPGSFTGVRIGVAMVKGLAQVAGKPCAGVSSLEALAYNFSPQNCIVCCAMDARCGQVYAALFHCENGAVKRLTPDMALMAEELWSHIKHTNSSIPVVFAGDGAQICYDLFADRLTNISLAPGNLRLQRASGTALLASTLKSCCFINAAQLKPIYLRVPQAERELKNRNEGCRQ